MLDSWSTGSPHLAGMRGQPARICERLAQEELDLGIRAADLVTGPAGECVVDSGIETEQHALALAHWGVSRLLVQGSGVDNLLGGLLAAEHYQQV